MAEPKLFTVQEANRLLPTIRPLLTTLRTLRDTMTAQQKRIDVERVTGAAPATMHGPLKQLHHTGADFHGSMETLHLLGVELKDLDTGLLDFYAKRDGELIFLCWIEGERTVTHWHTLEGGFAGRRPLK